MDSSLSAAERRKTAIDLMTAYATRTGLTSDQQSRRYLWTDAFAVCNFIGLSRATGEHRYQGLALRLIDRVHHSLGRHRPDDSRAGWLSGLGPEEGERHPTRGGLRIGKKLPERAPEQSYDPALEWDRDGQYFHYLTKWMHALDVVARTTHESEFARWSVELAEVAHRAFTSGAPGSRRMVWKMSIDLSRPLVPSMGQHDPLDGYVTYTQLAATAAELDEVQASLRDEIADFANMMKKQSLATDDPLGLGGLLSDAYRLAVLERRGGSVGPVVETLLNDALDGLESYVSQHELRQPAHRRLAFRELGLAIGLAAISALRQGDEHRGGGALTTELEALEKYAPLGERIISFWLEPEHRRAATWAEHRDINEVMLATSLVPEGFLHLPPAS